jgi:hypothetical protein
MNKFLLERDVWYRERDDRTRRMDGVSGFEDFSLGVIISSKVRSSYAIQTMTTVALNILARWCREIEIQVPSPVPSRLPSHQGMDLTDVLTKALAEIDPYGQFSFNGSKMDCCDQILAIGPLEDNEKLTDRNVIWIDGSGWDAGVGRGFPIPQIKNAGDENPVGPAFAACLGAAEVFRQAIGMLDSCPTSVWYSLYDFSKMEHPHKFESPPYASEFDFGRIHQVGCGAVASSLDFFLTLTKWKGEVHLVDFDEADVTNCNRSLSFSAYDAAAKKAKTGACADVLRQSRMNPLEFKGSYADFIREKGFLNAPPDLILCLANERNVWADIQNNFPPVVFHATTTPNWGINFGRHIPKKEWCIMCRFSGEIKHSPPICGEVEVSRNNQEEKPILGVLPFLSATAAVLILAEMAKIPLDKYPINKDFVEFSMKNPNSSFLTTQRNAERGCMCNEQSVDLYPKNITRSKFWRLGRVTP